MSFFLQLCAHWPLIGRTRHLQAQRTREERLRLASWRQWVALEGMTASSEFLRRYDPQAPLQEHIAKWLPQGRSRVSVLDVGAGAMTSLGKQVPGVSIELVACDPLADEFNKLPDLGTPPVRTEACEATGLVERFGFNRFDITHAQDVLDREVSPLTAILDMVAVTRPRGIIVLDHQGHAALGMGYKGFALWNFFVRRGELHVGRGFGRVNIDRFWRGLAEPVEVSVDATGRIRAVYRKLDPTTTMRYQAFGDRALSERL